VRARGGERAIRAVGVEDQQAGTATETENRPGIWLDLSEFGGYYFVPAKVGHGRRDEKSQHWIEE
jgi:hypothetical protein